MRKHVELHIEDEAKKGEAKRASMRMKEEAEEKRKEKITRQRDEQTTRRERAKRGGGGRMKMLWRLRPMAVALTYRNDLEW